MAKVIPILIRQNIRELRFDVPDDKVNEMGRSFVYVFLQFAGALLRDDFDCDLAILVREEGGIRPAGAFGIVVLV